MFNDLENQTNDAEELKMIKNLKILMWMTLCLGILRILSLDIMLLISDLLSALMIYFYARSRNKCMAIFCGVNGLIGIIYASIKFFSSWTLAKDNWFSLYYNLLVCIAIYAVITYSAIIYYSYLGIKRYQMMPLSMPSQETSNYGAVDVPSKTNYVAFSGKGTTVGN